MTASKAEGAATRRIGLLKAFREQGDVAARDRLVADCLPLISSLARPYANRGEQLDDLIQVGSIGLLKAIERFDAGRGVEFTNYAAAIVLGEIRHHLRDNVRLIRIPRTLRDLYARLYTQREVLTTTLGRVPTDQELGVAAGMAEAEVFEVLQVGLAFRPASLSAPVGDDDGKEVPLVELLGGEDPAFQVAENRSILTTKLKSLAPRERQILHMRYHRDLTQSRIGVELGMTQMHVSRLIRKALHTLSEPAEIV